MQEGITGKKGSTNKPKEPTPLVKQGEPVPPSKPKESAVIVKTKPQGPPAKVGDPAPPVIAKEVATPKAKSDAVPSADGPKAEGQTKPPLTLASKSRKLEFRIPSKPEKPPTQPQAEIAAQEDDEDEDLQAAVHASLQAPSSPQPPSGAQSSAPKPAVDLDQQESELLAHLDRLMGESLRLESLPNPTVREKSRIRSIATVSDDIEKKVREIEAQRSAQSSSKVRKTQESKAPAVTATATLPVSQVKEASVTSVAPPSTQRRDERSRSSERPEPPPQQQPELSQTGGSASDDPTSTGGQQLAIKDKPARPRFDPAREHVIAQRIAERGRTGKQPSREDRRDPSTERTPDRDEERRIKRSHSHHLPPLLGRLHRDIELGIC